MAFTTASPWQNLVKPHPGGTLTEYFLTRAQNFIDHGMGAFNWIVEAETEESYNYANYNNLTRNIASALYKKGLRTGDTLIYLNTSIIKQKLIHDGVWRCNGTVRSSFPDDNEETLLFRIKESKAKFLVCEVESVDYVFSTIKGKVDWQIEVIVYGTAEGCTSADELFLDDGSACPELKITEDSPAAILCTSGTTGKSKGAVLTHKVLLSIVRQFELIPMENNSLMCMKATHASGLVFTMDFFVQGKKLVVLKKTSLENILSAIDKYKPKAMMSFPFYYLGIVNNPDNFTKYDLTSVEVCICGGVRIAPNFTDNLKKFPNFKNLVILYGLTECFPVSANLDFSIQDRCITTKDTPPGSVGKLCPNVWLRIRDFNSGKILGPGEQGEICVKGPTTFAYYLNQPEETRGTFIDNGTEWLKTGDLGYVDQNGYLFVVDRIKEVFKCGANHVSPAEIDAIILEHPAVGDVCVVGIPDPEGDDLMPRAFLTLKKGSSATAQEIKEFANSKLAKYKHLRGGLYIVNELPVGLSGKVTRQLVAKLPIPSE